MSETNRQENPETDCEVSVYEGSWATCDMGADEEEDTNERMSNARQRTFDVE